MENYIGLAAVLAAFAFSKNDRRVPLVIAVYYVINIALIESFFGSLKSVFSPITISHHSAALWYLLITALNTLVIIALLSLCKRTILVKFYACVITLSSIYNALGAFFSALSMDWYSDIYLLHQQYAIQLDIAVAWLASDNVISRKINGAFILWRKENRQ